MNYHRVLLSIHKNSLTITRNYSALYCVHPPGINTIKHKSFKSNISNTFSPVKYSRRNLSLDGIIKWQEQNYNSISSSSAVNFVQEQLIQFHDMSGLNWSATIVICTVLVRIFITLPFAIQQNRVLAKLENVHLELDDSVNEIKKETANARKTLKLTDKQTLFFFKRTLAKRKKALIERDNCHPLKSILGIWFQIPIWFCMSFALRNIVNMYPPDPTATIRFLELSVGGFGWIPNLTSPDATYILPVLFGMTNLGIIELQRLCKFRQTSKLNTIFTNIFRVFSVLLIPISATVPSCICLYWTTSSIISLVQNISLVSPTVRRKLRIPEAPSELKNPYSTINDKINLTLTKLIHRKPRIKKVLPRKT